MAIKRRVATLTMAATTGSVTIGLGAAYGNIFKFELKGDDADVNASTTFGIKDADGRVIFAATALDAGTDDSTALNTGQTYSTFGLGYTLAPQELHVRDRGGDVSANPEGNQAYAPARSPVVVSTASGTSGDVFQVTLWVEV